MTNVEWEDFGADGFRSFVGNLVLYIDPVGFGFGGKRNYEYGIEISVDCSDVDVRLGSTSLMPIQEMKDEVELCWIHNRLWLENLATFRNQDDF